MKALSKKTKLIISIVLVVLILICVAAIAIPAIKKNQAMKTYEYLQMKAVKEQDVSGISNVELPEEAIASKYEDFPGIDFNPLWEENEDVCAWIRIPNTDPKVDYPILRKKDAESPYDTYYLNATIDGTQGLPGSIYMEPCNSSNFQDYNTVLYGHNMKDRSMFGGLREYASEEYAKEHPYIYIVTPEKNFVYEVASAVYMDDRHLMFGTDYLSEEGRQAYLDVLTSNTDSRNMYRSDVTITPDDRWITLSTCVGDEDDRRLLITAVLREEQEIQ